jgi:hypothetical protein
VQVLLAEDGEGGAGKAHGELCPELGDAMLTAAIALKERGQERGAAAEDCAEKEKRGAHEGRDDLSR